MTTWSNAVTWGRLFGLIAFSASLIPLLAAAAPTPMFSPADSAKAYRQTAARQAPSGVSSLETSVPGFERRLQSRVTEARHALTELQAFVEEATRTVELGDQLKTRRLQNDRLRKSLMSSQAAKKLLENHVTPARVIVSALTKTVVRNWLETVRLENRSDKVDREMIASENAWLKMEGRVAALRRTLAKRRSELHALRAESAVLAVELGRVRQQITRTNADTRRIEYQRDRIAATTFRLRRNVMSTLRSILLENDEL